jgi:hypothetical protein
MPPANPMFGPEITRRPVLASFDRYEDAQKAVDTLSDNGFPVQNVAIVGVDLRMVEAVLGRWSWGRSALSGMGTGAWFGMLLGLFVSLFVEADAAGSQLILMGLLYGAAFGIVFGLISYAFTRGRRDFVSRQSLVAARYDVLCEAEVMGRAREILRPSGSTWPPPLPPESGEASPPAPPGPPRPDGSAEA